MTYRNAKCIELYDSHIGFAQNEDGYVDTYLPGRNDYASRAAYKIPLLDLMHVFSALKLGCKFDGIADLRHFSNIGATHQDHSQMHGEDELVNYSEYEINLFCHIDDIGGNTIDFEIVSLEVDVLGAHLVNIRIGLKWLNSEEIEIDLSEMTYSGTFQIWW